MDKFVIQGGAALYGEIPTNGSKNSALPALAAALLTEEPVMLSASRGCATSAPCSGCWWISASTVDVEARRVRLHTAQIVCPEAPYELVKTMRASSLVLGPLVARCGRARVSLPGGCAIGARPINLHIFGLEQLGAQIHQEHGYIEAVAPDGLRGATVHFDRITVTGTEDLMMAAVLAKGETVLRQRGARARGGRTWRTLLTKMGAKIEGAGTSTIRDSGRRAAARRRAHHHRRPHRSRHVPDCRRDHRRRSSRSRGCDPEHLGALVSKLQQAGVEVTQPDATTLRVRGSGRAPQRGHDHRGVSRLRHRPAGAVHGADDAGRRHRHHRRDDLREPLHARAGTGAHGRQYPARRQAGDRRRPAAS